ncbi:MAG: hypothetical protein RSA29_16920 [Clostridium sp.]|uniref:hypothetical protein n=1 Tax=Clostridium sp. TaxID=1506 RepID=UPI00304A6F7B
MKIGSSKNLFIGVVVIIVSIFMFIYLGGDDGEKNYITMVNKWDNLYKGNNIKFYYMDEGEAEIIHLKSKCEIDKIVNEKDDEILKALDIEKWLKARCEISLTAMETKKNAEELLIEMGKGAVVSQKDYNTIMEELLTSVGVTVRVGEYRLNESYSVIEIWDSKRMKWIMVDGFAGGYLECDGEPLSAIEVLNSDLKNLTLDTGEKKMSLEKSHVKILNSSLGTYTIKVDNNKYDKSVINSYVTYVKEVEDIQVETDKGYIQPTIFVEDEVVFNISPCIDEKEYKADEIPTMIFSKRDMKEDGEGYIKFVLGTFMNSTMLRDFYIRINGGEYIKVDTYYSLSVETGNNLIEISVDGVNTVRSVIINKE